MSMLGMFLTTWRLSGLRVAWYNLLFLYLHRHDDHVRVWQNGECCSGCERGGKGQ